MVMFISLLRVTYGCLFFLLVAMGSSSAIAADAVGWVQEAKGDASILSGAGASRTAALEMGFVSTETLKTGVGGRLQVMFRDKTTLALDENSEVHVKDVMLDEAAAGNQRFVVSILKGTIGLLAGAIAKKKPDQFRIDTPLAYMGIRGTEIASAVDKTKETHGLFEGGPVSVTAKGAGASGAADPAAEQKRQELCKKLDEAIDGYVKASKTWESKRDNSQAMDMADKAQNARMTKKKYQCK